MKGYESYRIKNEAQQLLNSANNFNFDKKNLFDIVRIYNKILDDKSFEFSKSLENSEKILKSEDLEEYDKYINEGVFLEDNNNDSFIILPMFSGNHAFYGILRKINNEYSCTVINRGFRGKHKKYEEYIIFDIKNFMKFLKKISVQWNIETEEIYLNILNFSKRKNSIRVDSSEQKVKNCLVKELEAAIKYVYSTRNKNEKSVDLIELRNEEGDFYRPKWNVSELEIHRRYIEVLKEENCELKDTLDNIYKAYLINKKIRENVKRLSLKNSINKIFANSDSAIQDFFKNIDIKNFADLMDQIDKIVPKDLEYKYIKLKTMYKHLTFKYTLKLFKNEDFAKLSKDFANICDQLKEEYANMYFEEACKISSKFYFKESEDLVEQSISLIPFKSKAYILRTKLAGNSWEFTKRCIDDCNKAIEMEPCSVINYTEKIKYLKIAGKYDEYESALLKILKFGKMTREMCDEAVNIFELDGYDDKALRWLRIEMSIYKEDANLKNRERILLNKLNDKWKITFTKIQRNSRSEGIGM